MSDENLELVRRSIEAFNRGDLDAAVADASPDMEYVATGAIPDLRGVFRGRKEYRRFLHWVSDAFDDGRTEASELIDLGDQVVVALTITGRGRQSGVETSWDIWQLWTLRDGKFVHGQSFMSREEALDAARPSE
jgi:ketosteroid isomerase-like protein